MTRVPGEYEPLYWDGEPSAHYVNGHVSDEDFRAAIAAFYGNDLLVPADAVIEHVYVRTVKAPEGSEFDREWRESPKGRGAFPMTVWNLHNHRGRRKEG